MLQKLEARLAEYAKAIEESAARHNSMMGAMNELKILIQSLKDAEPVVNTVVDAVAPQLEPAINAVEEVVNSL